MLNVGTDCHFHHAKYLVIQSEAKDLKTSTNSPLERGVPSLIVIQRSIATKDLKTSTNSPLKRGIVDALEILHCTSFRSG